MKKIMLLVVFLLGISSCSSSDDPELVPHTSSLDSQAYSSSDVPELSFGPSPRPEEPKLSLSSLDSQAYEHHKTTGDDSPVSGSSMASQLIENKEHYDKGYSLHSRLSETEAGKYLKKSQALSQVTEHGKSCPPLNHDNVKTIKPDSNDGKSHHLYIVERGDTLYGIAEKCYGDGGKWRIIHEANNDLVFDKDRLRVGWVLNIPK